ncbi:MAG: sugar transferase [Flavobacteriales bacterium TMED84]|nr:MAG: sugar transferase [Flavobacteriales bacterium TMED84]|tara:strand:- start:3892 stop:4476 length:585 start_codon:yes stop_codon:yes gene_type:complete
MILKRIFDIILSALAIFLFFPILLIVSFLIVIDSGFPIFFLQKRIGRGAKAFNIIKFRTMKINNDNITITVSDDNRITRIGKYLRKTKIDELPEILNVLFGQMSFVGPRPDVKGYADKLKGENRKILALRPGITGPASLKYYNEEYILSNKSNPKKYNDEVIFPDKVKINLDYFYNRSFVLDLKIIFATIFRIF